MENNSKEDTKTVQITELIKHFENSGYNKQLLQQLKEKTTEKLAESSEATATTTTDDRTYCKQYRKEIIGLSHVLF